MAKRKRSRAPKQLREKRAPSLPIPRPKRQVGSSGESGDQHGLHHEMSGGDESWLPVAWTKSRAGARAARGFHFQDAVGGWFASRLASGDLSADRLVPEGLDDIQIEGIDSVQVEVKSRQLQLGPFPVSTAAQHISRSWLRHQPRFGAGRKLMLVFEEGIAGLRASGEAGIITMPLAQVFGAVNGLREAVVARSERGGLSASDFEALEPLTEVVIATWGAMFEDTALHIGHVVALPPAALRRIALALRCLVADTVDENAAATFEHHVALDKTRVVNEIQRAAESFDVESLERALVQGTCTLVDMSPLATGDAYYEGLATQPGHVGAGLVVPRPDLAEQVIQGLSSDKAVLLTGPSGVGKSAVLWTLPKAVPGVTWFRVNRISERELPDIELLVRAHATSSGWSVGLLADSVGRGDLEDWSRLRTMIASTPGALLVGTARSEDLFTLNDLADYHVVTVKLDDSAAATIHAGLRRRGATTTPHWRETLEQSNGLTLEFTYLLTRGTHLRDVVSDQVSDRVREGRDLECDILALVSTADRWSASLSTNGIEAQLGVRSLELKAAMERLVEEHLIVDNEGSIAGVHQVRSKAISEAIHKHPPPRLVDSVLSVLRMLRSGALSRFVYEVLRDAPDLEEDVLGVLHELALDDVEQLLAGLRALETARLLSPSGSVGCNRRAFTGSHWRTARSF